MVDLSFSKHGSKTGEAGLIIIKKKGVGGSLFDSISTVNSPKVRWRVLHSLDPLTRQ